MARKKACAAEVSSSARGRGRRELPQFSKSITSDMTLIVDLAKKDSPFTVQFQDPRVSPNILPTNSKKGGSLGSAAKTVKDSETDLDDIEMKTEDMEPDEIFKSSSSNTRTGIVKKTLQGVVIPASNIKSSARRGTRVISSQSPSPSDSEIFCPYDDRSSEYETPGTSAAVTPAESLSAFSRNAGMNKPTDTAINKIKQSKRKREGSDGDALLAQILQEEEYQDIKPENSILKRRQRIDAEDSEDELEHIDSMDGESTKASRQPNKRLRPNGRLSLPTRAARDSARKSIVENHRDTDSGESELSEYTSDDDLEDLEDSDASEDEGYDATATTDTIAATSTATTEIRSNPVTARQRRRSAPATVTNRPRRRDWRSRMTSRVRLFAHFS